MKNKIFILLFSALIGLFSLNIANASCRWVPEHWVNGHHVPAHKVCYYTKTHCKWVAGHYYHGVWYPKHKVCWHN